MYITFSSTALCTYYFILYDMLLVHCVITIKKIFFTESPNNAHPQCSEIELDLAGS